MTTTMTARLLFLMVLLLGMATVGMSVPPEEEEETKPKVPPMKAPKEAPRPAVPAETPKGGLPGVDPSEKPTMPRGDTTPPQGLPPTPPTATEPTTPSEGDNAGAYLAKMPDLVREAALAKHPQVKTYFEKFPVAYDRIVIGTRRAVRVTPVPLFWGKDKFPAEFGVVPFNEENELQEIVTAKSQQVRSLVPFENVVLDETERFLARSTALTTIAPDAERFAAAEKVLTAVYFFHDSAREQNRRRGKNWEPVKVAIYDKLAVVRLERLSIAGKAKDWAKLKEMTTRYAELYRANPKLLEAVFVARLAEADALAGSDTPSDLFRARELLSEYEARFPNSKDETALRIRSTLKTKSAKMLEEAQRRFAVNKGEARNLLQNVEKIDPDNASLRSLQQEMKLGYPVLYVGTNRMPEFGSPALARFDSEKQVVSLVFEGLLEAVPDATVGTRFLPGLTIDRGSVGFGVREFRLQGQAEWLGKSSTPFSASDVAGTLRLMRQQPALPGSEAAMWLDDPSFDPADLNKLRVRFKLGHPDPRTLLTTKILPAGLLLETNRMLDDVAFAQSPTGTGPFRFTAKIVGPNDVVKEVILPANGAYSKRSYQIARPYLREIRYLNTSQSSDLVADFRADRLHLITDVPTQDLPLFQADNNLSGKVRVVTAKNPHKIQILAINHRRPGLQQVDVRRGLSHAIDRDRVLTDIFRTPARAEFHQALSGPFPPKSWAVPKPLGSAPPALFNRDLAAAKFRTYLSTPAAVPNFTLIYPNDNALARSACERLKTMIESPTSTEERRILIQLEPLPPRELIRRVEVEGRYDLAYLDFDYEDDWFPRALGVALDPTAAVRQGRNYFGWMAQGTQPTNEDQALAQSLSEVRLYRDQDARLMPLAHKIHEQFNEAVPFIPLWQLDRHMVISRAVKLPLDGLTGELNPELLNPTTLFTNVGKWRVE